MKPILAPILALLVAFANVGVSAQLRNLQQNLADILEEENPNRAEGQLGSRKLCGDTEFTLVCLWEAERKQSKSKSRRRLGADSYLDYEDEEEGPEQRRTTAIDVEERRLTVALEHVECTLGIGKKDSDDSDEDYEEYTERVPFPDREWELEIRKAKDIRVVFKPNDYYRFKRTIFFEGIEDPNNSADEVSVKAKVDVTLNVRDGGEILGDILTYSSSSVSFDCPAGF